MAVSVEEARKELARRELARRRSEQQQRPAAIAASEQGESWSPTDPVRNDNVAVQPTGVIESRTPGLMERAGEVFDPTGQIGRNFEAADDAARSFANAATFSQADRLAQFFTGEDEAGKTELGRQRNPAVTGAAEIAGSVAMPMGLAKNGVTLAGRFGTSGMKGITGLLARMGLMGGEGAAYGAAQAAGEGEDIGAGAGLGFGFGAGGQAIGEGVGSIINLLSKAGVKVPSLDDLAAAKSAAYKQAHDLGVAYRPEAYQKLVLDIAETARAGHMNGVRHPASMNMLKTLGDLGKTDGAPSLADLDSLRQVIWRDVAGHSDDAEAFFGKMMSKKLDDFIDSADSTAVLSGNAEEAAAAIKEARELNRRFRNAKTLDTAVTKAERRAASTDSGGNEENAIRQNVRRILDNEDTARFLNPAEKQALEDTVRGTPGQNAARWVGKKLTSIPGQIGALGLGGGVGSLAGMDSMLGATALPIIAAMLGGTLKAGSRSIGRVNEQVADALIRTGKGASTNIDPAQVSQVVRLLLGGAGAGSITGR